MPKILSGLPKYRRHSSRNVVLNGKRVYLSGPYGSKESRQEYRRLCLEWEVQGRPSAPIPTPAEITISELMVRYWQFATLHYVKNGRPTDEIHCVKSALRLVKELYGSIAASAFGPLALKAVRERMITEGFARGTINKNVGRIKRFFRWCASEELVPASIWQNLASVQGLQRGRTDATERPPVLPVNIATVEATLPHMPPVVADMVKLQLSAGMRPGEVCLLRPCDIDRTGPVWKYVPMESKMEHKGRGRIIFIGPQGQAILLPYLLRSPEAFCFVPKESEAKRRALATEQRATPASYGNAVGTNRKRSPKRPAGTRYDTGSYHRAIQRACEIAFKMPKELRFILPGLNAVQRKQFSKHASEWRAAHCWGPNRLRHTKATAVRAEYGIEAVKTVLGHSDVQTSLIYAERDEKLAEQIALKLG